LMGVLAPGSNEPDPDGDYHLLAEAVQAPRGSVLRFLSNGAGGWGDPLDRDPAAVLDDVRNEYVSIVGALRDYGVVVFGDPTGDPEGLTLDNDATERVRAERRSV